LSEFIPYGRQSVNDADIEAVVDVLRSDYLTQGSTVPAFESGVAQKVSAKHAVAVNSATSALHIACLALELGSGDWLWTVSNTFVSSANCALYCGAKVDFVDIDPKTLNMSPDVLSSKLEKHRKLNLPLPKVVIPVHFSGQPTEQEKIWHLSKEYGFSVLEDASHSIGASRYNEPVGSCRWSNITVFSFHPVKIITSGEGGMALTNDEDLACRMRVLRSHGVTRDEDKLENESVGPWYYEQQYLGFNYRMTEIQAALGLSQLQRLDEFVSKRNEKAQLYNVLLADLPLQLPSILSNNQSSFHLYVVRLYKQKNPYYHRKVFEELRMAGIGVNLHYMPVHLQPYYRRLGFTEGICPEAEKYGCEAITLPLFPTMSLPQQENVCNKLKYTLTHKKYCP
jgi:UDP-4-amino-4,6-dideoxy-N-acetyl-beta-L-altrosamine transaminase